MSAEGYFDVCRGLKYTIVVGSLARHSVVCFVDKEWKMRKQNLKKQFTN
jgi:hypothetical protein